MSTHVLSVQTRTQIDAWLAKFPPEQKRSALLPALHIVQDENRGFLTEALMDAVAAYLELPRIAVLEVATFYSMYELKPVGRHKISVCTNISCMLRGSKDVMKHIEQRLNIKTGETTPDQKFTLKEAECLAACGGAPMMQIDRTYYENLTPEKIDSILVGLE
jgi:NADH-quinone oxidoreductase subunit E